MKLYTKTGDKGSTSLIGGTRVNKNDPRLEAYGTIDELNSHIGMLIAMNIPAEIAPFLYETQKKLFTIGSHLATDTSKTEYNTVSIIHDGHIEEIEKEIDKIQENLVPLKYFILPGGSVEAAQSHICRTVARRAERNIIAMKQFYDMDERILIYTNRLSDYFFALSRFIIKCQKKQEIYWK